VARVVYARRALDDLDRLLSFLAREDAAAAARSAGAIRSAVDLLAEHPLIGRVRRGDLRELVISFGKTGYVALYRFVPHRAVVRVLGFRHQRELDVPL
jgi:plasmid stabilization system protein ParE